MHAATPGGASARAADFLGGLSQIDEKESVSESQCDFLCGC